MRAFTGAKQRHCTAAADRIGSHWLVFRRTIEIPTDERQARVLKNGSHQHEPPELETGQQEERMIYSDILYGVDDFVATITFNRPDKLNAWTAQMEADVRRAVEEAATNEAVRAIVLTGAGRGFCAGADMSILSTISTEAKPSGTTSKKDNYGGNFDQRFSYLLAIPKPIFAAINGPIAGIAVCLSLFCDFRYMAEGAKLTTAFARRGLVAEHGISWMLPRLIGTMNALDLLHSARAVEAVEAERLGLVRQLPADGFLQRVQATARELVTTSSPRSISVIKRQVYQSYFQSLAEAWALADVEMTKSFGSEDFKEGTAHFVEKRPAVFTGR
jgi:enoyl-CoA hydratase/carnithine racemase